MLLRDAGQPICHFFTLYLNFFLFVQPKGLAEVETYNREEGTLMRFWYPISALERPTAGLARSSSLALCSEDRTRADIYCELLRNEAGLTRMYCREAHSRLLANKAKNDNQLTG